MAFGEGADAEDVVQSSFLKAYQALGRFRDGAAFRPWLLPIMADETRNTVRSAARLRAVADREALLLGPEPLIPQSADPAPAAVARQQRGRGSRRGRGPLPPPGGHPSPAPTVRRQCTPRRTGPTRATPGRLGSVRRRWGFPGAGARPGAADAGPGSGPQAVRPSGRQAVRPSGRARGRRPSGPPPPRGSR
ncbi:sigma-70 family RNA polymerase sigma factor [Streptomyces xantholiticus]|uniref:sigma-70 family RNA polymerase sigma factor n=1 Tax=Streptomyces xantholiticus TaxID=68285 RepID=UPI003D9F81A2